MMKLTPCNRHILLQPTEPLIKEDIKITILVPDEYSAPKSRHEVYKVLAISQDCEKFIISQNDYVLVDNSMVEEIEINDKTFYLLLENYVYGVITNFKE